MKSGLILLILSCLVIDSLYSNPARPNILIINIDDMGWRDTGFMGSEFYETPVMDQLVSQGMVFSNGYASASNCAPSRACLMSGQWMPRHGIFSVGTSERGESKNRKLVPVKNIETLDPHFKTLAQSLKEAGYTTCIAGKWHLSDNPLPYGFDVNIGGSHAGNPTSYYPPYKNVSISGPNTEYLTDLIMDKTIDFVKSTTSDKPFFLYYATYAVHSPIQKVDSLMYKFKDRKPWLGQSNKDYATMVNNEDRNIGRLLAAMKEKSVLDNTFIIFTSDNGGLNPVTYQHPLRAGKGSYFEGGIRVPLAFIWKDKIAAGSKSDLPVTNLDFYPTLMDVARVTTTEHLDGKSVYNYLLTKKAGKELTDRPLYWYFPIYLEGGNKETNDSIFRTRPGEAIRKGDWKLHHYFEDDAVMLYNLKDDIGEKNNLVSKYPATADELMKTDEAVGQENKCAASNREETRIIKPTEQP